MAKTKGQDLELKLLSKQKNIGEEDSSILGRSIEFCEGYKKFLTNKTEREVVDYTIPLLKNNGYKEYVRGTKYPAGSKVFFNNRGKNLVMITVGKKNISEGLRIGASHIDSPRLDFKPNPLFEDTEMAYFKTHYYGGIKKYQWSAIPLSLHGVVSLKNGSKVKVNIGEDEGDPSFCVTDLLPHLAKEQMKKPATEVILGEQLNILIGCWPYSDKEITQKVKLNVASILFEKYHIIEKDFLSAELCAVPAFAPRDIGLDRAMVGGYGQDDSVCAYANLIAEFDTKSPEYSTVTVFADKEETGSDGNTGMSSFFLKDFLEDFVSAYGLQIRHVLERSVCLSCDVNAAFDPAFSEVFEKNNASYLNHGAVISKYTGGGGKYSTNDASAETMSFLRTILDDANVTWQVGELGKVDIGGGGTIAVYLSAHNIDTVDIGVPVLSMHSPFEVVSKADVYMMYLAVHAFYNSARPK
ncbi:MAG: aminopeptidase [Candidatus Methanomethylophilaceae archaeon]